MNARWVTLRSLCEGGFASAGPAEAFEDGTGVSPWSFTMGNPCNVHAQVRGRDQMSGFPLPWWLEHALAFQQLHRRRVLPHVGDGQLFEGHKFIGVEFLSHDGPITDRMGRRDSRY